MRLIELHILQSFPVTCLNRDDVGAPKSAVFGGVERARVSSQSWKRAIRELANEEGGNHFDGQRGHFLAEKVTAALSALEVEQEKAIEAGEAIATFLGKKSSKYKEGHKTDVALFFSPGEIQAMAQAAKAQLDEAGDVDLKKGTLVKILKNAAPHDLADVAILGRMVASDHTLMVEGAGLFSHALSTHSISNDVDFFSAVDEMKHEDDEGAGHIGTLEFNSACYYRYIGLNLDLLEDEAHLAHFSPEERKQVIDTFLRACIMAVPQARKNSMFGHNPPAYIMGFNRVGQPLSLVNAFEHPVRAKQNGFIEPSIEALEKHWDNLRNLYSLDDGVKTTVKLPPDNIDAFIGKLIPEV